MKTHYYGSGSIDIPHYLSHLQRYMIELKMTDGETKGASLIEHYRFQGLTEEGDNTGIKEDLNKNDY